MSTTEPEKKKRKTPVSSSSEKPGDKSSSEKKAPVKRKVRTIACREGEEIHFKKLIVKAREELKIEYSGGKLQIDHLALDKTAVFKHDFSKHKGVKIGKIEGGITNLVF